LYLKRVGERARTVKEAMIARSMWRSFPTSAIEPLASVNLKKQEKFTNKVQVSVESACYRTSAIGEVGPPRVTQAKSAA
ncbi:hypothetical protein QUA81_27255, partial [Microcoleus sp. F6_B4]